MKNKSKIIGMILAGIGFALLWHLYDWELMLIIWLLLFANNLEQKNNGAN